MMMETVTRIEALSKERRNLNTHLKSRRQICDALWKDLMKFCKKRGKLADVRLTLEVSLYKNAIERPVYHGGDLTGVMVKKLFQNIDVVLDDFKIIIMNVNDRSADDREVELICERYNQLGFLFDAVFSIARTQSGRLTNNMKYDTRRYVKAALATWRSLRLSMLGPKVHAIEDHLVSSMEE